MLGRSSNYQFSRVLAASRPNISVDRSRSGTKSASGPSLYDRVKLTASLVEPDGFLDVFLRETPRLSTLCNAVG